MELSFSLGLFELFKRATVRWRERSCPMRKCDTSSSALFMLINFMRWGGGEMENIPVGEMAGDGVDWVEV